MKLSKHLNVISFDIPWPASYGGVIDVYYKLKALQQSRVKIILHCYEYGRERTEELNKICEEVHYYKRNIYKNPFYGKLPYIINTRNTKELIDNLQNNNYPILFEGLHTCYYLKDERLKGRTKIVRTHNIEHDYYNNLELVETNYFKKYFFKVEAEKLKKFQLNLTHASYIAAISPADVAYLSKRFKNVFHLPPFHENEQIISCSPRGEFILYHGNLGVGENDEAAKYLVREVFNKIDKPIIIAGNNPSKQLVNMAATYPHIKLITNYNSEQIIELIKQAHINVLPTFQATGIKLKLINALYNSRFCVVNNMMVKNTGLEPLCYIENTPQNMIKRIEELWGKVWTDNNSGLRESILNAQFSNQENSKKLIGVI